jgi:hypothetical protein
MRLVLGNKFLVYLPQGISGRDYIGQVVCAHGVVQVGKVQGSTFPMVDIRTRQDIAVIGGTGPYAPAIQQQQDGRQPGCPCAPGQMLDGGVCVPRWRADYYGGCR